MNTFFSSSIEPDTLLPLTSDVVFKEVLGQEESKPILMGFLNDILDMNITSPDQITLLNPELNPEYIDDKLSILHIRVQLQDHTSIDVEIQVIDQHNIEPAYTTPTAIPSGILCRVTARTNMVVL